VRSSERRNRGQWGNRQAERLGQGFNPKAEGKEEAYNWVVSDAPNRCWVLRREGGRKGDVAEAGGSGDTGGKFNVRKRKGSGAFNHKGVGSERKKRTPFGESPTGATVKVVKAGLWVTRMPT